MNEHPEDLLADYVDEELTSGDRARVDEHLATCQQCREEVELASVARGALAALPELDAPSGIPLAIRRTARTGPSPAIRRLGAVAVAAALVASAVVVIGSLNPNGSPGGGTAGGGGGDAATEERADSQAGEGGGALPATGATKSGDELVQEDAAPPSLFAAADLGIPEYMESDREYVSKDLAPLARKLRDDARRTLESGLAPTAGEFFESFDPEAFTPTVRQAIRCVLAEIPPSQLVAPFRIESASFEGSPAYIAAFLQGPTPDDPYDRIVIWVAHRESCSLLSLATQVL